MFDQSPLNVIPCSHLVTVFAKYVRSGKRLQTVTALSTQMPVSVYCLQIWLTPLA